MRKIIVIEDDIDDQNIIRLALTQMDIENELVILDNTDTAYEYLLSMTEPPYVVISDINLPGKSGLQLKEQIEQNPDLPLKCIPYVFLTTSAMPASVYNAYSKSAQGYFIKPNTTADWCKLIMKIIDYWGSSLSPQQSATSIRS